MRKTRCLAFLSCASTQRRSSGSFWHRDWLSRARDATSTTTITTPRSLRPGTPVSSTVRSGPLCDPQTSVVDGGTTVADGSSPLDDRHGRTVEVAARRREQPG